MPRASPGSSISLDNPIFQQKTLSTGGAQHASVTPDRTGLCSPATGNNARRSPVGHEGLWKVQSSAVQAAIDEQKLLAAALDSPEASPQGARRAPPSDRAQARAVPGSKPEESRQAAAGAAARSSAANVAQAASCSTAMSGPAKRTGGPKEGAVRNWWEAPEPAEGVADGGRAQSPRCTLAHSVPGTAATRPHDAAGCAHDRASSPPSSEVSTTLHTPCPQAGHPPVRHCWCCGQHVCPAQQAVQLGLLCWQHITT